MSSSMSYFGTSPIDAFGSSFNSTNSIKNCTRGPAFETAVASYASRILKKKSPPESAIDSSVGPYVASKLRSALESKFSTRITITDTNTIQVENLDEYGSLMELLEEHCNMSEQGARSALQYIAKAILTGVFDDDESRGQSTYGSVGSSNGFSGAQMRKYRSLSLGAENDYVGGRFRSLSIGTREDENQNGMTNSIFFSEMVSRGEMDQPLCSKNDIADNTMIEEEPSFLFEEDEIPGQQHGYSSTVDFSSNVTSPSTLPSEKKMKNPSAVMPQSTISFTPLKPDRLIPEDLLGLIDDPSTPSIHKTTLSASYNETNENHAALEKTLNTHPTPVEQQKMTSDNENKDKMTTLEQPQPQPNAPRPGNKKKKIKRKDMDLAASLFSRPRSRSVHDVVEKSPKLKPMVPPPASLIGLSGLNCASATAVMNNSIPALFEKQLASAVQILLAMNYDLCEEAAHEAALVSNADVNIAQHVIDGALSAPPVCRHMLHDGCYRSDCQFSHDVDGHTCLFWLKGRCGKGDTCKFMHGFSEKLLDGVEVDFLSPSGGIKETNSSQPSSAPIAIKTTNLVQHNMRAPYTLQTQNRQGQESCIHLGSLGNGKDSTPPLSHSPSTSLMQQHAREHHQSLPKSTFSFASIASKGYSEKSSFNSNKPSGINSALHIQNGSTNRKETKTVKIPQNLWSPFYNRCSNAFHISDPLARYKEVSSSTLRDDVIDLHFQSIKTFPVVLSTILPEKLRDHEEIWIVTGSGHHVSGNSHQKGGGVLENAVVGWLASNDYIFLKGKDKNGHSGACLVRGRNR